MDFPHIITLTKKSPNIRTPTNPTHPTHNPKGNRKNNKMEQMNGEIRDREKGSRLKKDDTVLLLGYQLYHNYLDHMKH